MQNYYEVNENKQIYFDTKIYNFLNYNSNFTKINENTITLSHSDNSNKDNINISNQNINSKTLVLPYLCNYPNFNTFYFINFSVI